MRQLKVGLSLTANEDPTTGRAPSWEELRGWATLAESIGFDAIWVPDELLWRQKDWPGPAGFWECVALTGALAASTTRIEIGTWVLANLHRNPTLTVKIATTLDEIAGGRFIFGLGAGSPGAGEAVAFGFPHEQVYARFEEALAIIVPLLRAGRVDHHGKYYDATDLELRPMGPRGSRLPLLIGAGGPRMMRLAAKHADIWSWFATEGSRIEAFTPLLAEVDRACDEVGRDPKTLERSIGLVVEPTEVTGASMLGFGEPLRGSSAEIAHAIREFAARGVTRVETFVFPPTTSAIEAMAPVIEDLAGS